MASKSNKLRAIDMYTQWKKQWVTAGWPGTWVEFIMVKLAELLEEMDALKKGSGNATQGLEAGRDDAGGAEKDAPSAAGPPQGPG